MATPVPSNAGFISVDTNVGKTFTMPLSTDLVGRVITFKDSTGGAQSGAIQIQTQGGDTFQDGTSLYIIQEAYGSATFVSRSGYWVLQQGNAQVIASSITTTNLRVLDTTHTYIISSLSLYSDNVFARNNVIVQDGNFSVQNSSGLSPYTAVFATSNLNVDVAYGINGQIKWEQIVRDIATYPMGFVYGQGPEILTLDGKNSKVGIVVKNPQYQLDVSGSAFASSFYTGTLNLLDINSPSYNALTTSSGVLLLNGSAISGGGGGGGVAQILAGSNISISPGGGTGAVTINAAGNVSTGTLVSSIEGLGTSGYVSTLSLVSTTEGMIYAVINLINSLGSAGYLSTSQLVSSIEGLGSSGYLSSGGQGYFSTLYVNVLPQDAPLWNSNLPSFGFDPEPNPLAFDVYGSARILKNLYIGSTTTIIGTGGVQSSNVFTNRVSAGTTLVSSIGLIDSTGLTYYLQASNGSLIFNSNVLAAGSFGSTIEGLGTYGYVSTPSMTSSINAAISSFSTAFGPGGTSVTSLTSTVRGLGSAGYISTASLRSTVVGLGQLYPSTTATGALFSTFSTSISRNFNTSNATISTLFASNATMSNLTVSTITFDTGDGFLDFPDIRSLSLSTFLVNTSTLNANVLSTQVLEVSSIRGITFLSPETLTSSLVSTTGGLQREFNTAGFLSSANLVSTTGGLEYEFNTAGFLSSANLLSTTGGLQREFNTAGFLSSANLLSTTGGLEYEFNTAGFLSSANLISTTGGLEYEFNTAGFLSSANLVSTTGGLQREFNTAGFLSTPNLTSSIQGLGTYGYISSASLASSIISTTNFIGQAISSFSTANGPGGLTTANLVSTIQGLGSSQYISSTQLISTTRGLGSSGYISSIPAFLTASAILTSSLLASTITTSSLQVNSLTIGTGTGWVNLGPIQTVAISSIQDNTNALYANTSFFGTTSTATALQFYGLFGNYNNTALAELSTGAGTQEFLIFKGSSTSDRVRVQTTGTFAIETGVSARLYNTTNVGSNVTPAFVINTSSNVGIQTASPGAALDVAGVSRAITLSSQQLFFSSVNGGLPLSITSLTSTTAGITAGYATAGFLSSPNLISTTAGITAGYATAGFLSTPDLVSTTKQLQSNIENWSQYTTTTDITLSNGSGIIPTDPNAAIQLKTHNLLIADINGGYGYLNMGDSLTMLTSSSLENYSMGFGPLGTGSISSFVFVRSDTITSTTAPVYISSLYLGNLGGTVAGQLTTDGTATDLFWKGSKLNGQSGGGGGAIDYVSAFTVSTASLQVSSISSYYIECYGVIGSAFFNIGPDNLAITSLTDATINANSTIINTNAFHVTSSNDARFVITSNAIFDSEQATFSNIYCYNTISTYSMAVYGPQTLTVNGVANLTQVGLSSINGTQFPGTYICQGKLTSNIDIQQTLDTVIPFEVDIDPNGWLVDAGSNTAKFQPTIAGYYTIAFQVWWDRDSTVEQDNIQIRKNGNSIAIAQSEIPHNTGLTQYTSKIGYLNGSNDYIDFTAYTGTGSLTQTIFYGGSTESPGTFFSAHLLR